jgi:DNA-binding LacI/PurR family transcriptional regulator
VKTGGEAANGRATRIDEVARAAGVSITTVSHVYSGRRPVKAKTRARVLEAAERLRYRRQPSAVALATGRTMTIALHLSMGGAELIFNPFYSALFPSLSLGAVKHGYSLLFFPENDVPAADALITDNKFDGAIVLDPRRGDSFVGRLIEAGKPYVSLGRALTMAVDEAQPSSAVA